MKQIVVVGVVTALLALTGSLRVGAQADRVKLATAFAEIDRIFTEFTVQAHVPGAADLSQMMRGGIPFSTSPGTAYEYSNYGFAILGRVVSNVSGMRYDEYVAANILRPLGMTSTTLEASKVPADRLAHGYRWEDNRWKDEPLLPHGAFGSMGGMLTSVRDLSRYVAAFLSAWPPRDGPETAPIRRASLREMQQVWRPAPASVTRTASDAIQLNAGGYGFGLRISQTCSFAHLVSHGGGLPGFGSTMQWLP